MNPSTQYVQSNSYDEMINKLKSYKFYAPGDEASELFVSMCRLLYFFTNVGIYANDPRVQTLLKWIEEYCNENEKWVKENCEESLGVTFDQVEYITGINAYGIIN